MRVVFAVLAAALVLLLWWLVRDDPSAVEVGAPPATDTATPAPVLVGGGEPTNAAENGAAPASLGSVWPDEARVVGWIEVRVLCPDPEDGFQARVYALPAGSPGASGTYEVGHGIAQVDPAEEVQRIPVLLAGRYDVGAVCEWGAVLREDVEVAAGAVVPVTLTLPERSYVRVHLQDPWSMRGHPNVRGMVVFEADRALPGRPAPGRRERYAPICSVSLHTDWQGGHMPKGIAYNARVRLVGSPVNHATTMLEMHPGTRGLLLEPARVRVGTDVKVGLPDVATIPLRFEFVGAWPADASLQVALAASGSGWLTTYRWYREVSRSRFDGEDYQKHVAILVPAQGESELTWSGTGIEPGRIALLHERLGAREPLVVPLRFAEREGHESLPVVVRGGPDDAPVHLRAWRGSKYEEGNGIRAKGLGTTREVRLPRTWRGSTHIQAFSESGWISAVRAVPQEGGVVLELVQGGFVTVVVPGGLTDAAGALTLQRTDEMPMIEKREMRSPWWVDDGDRIGPLLPGPVEFQLRIGRRFKKTVRVDVRAGETVELQFR